MSRNEQQAADIATVVWATGCSEDEARSELIAEEWDIGWAIAHIRHFQAQAAH